MKKKSYLLLYLTALLNIGLAQKATLIHSENILQKPPFAECHASTIVELSKGKLMASWFGGTRESNPDVTIWIAFHENGHWSDPLSIADGIVNDTLRYPLDGINWSLPSPKMALIGQMFSLWKMKKRVNSAILPLSNRLMVWYISLIR